MDVLQSKHLILFKVPSQQTDWICLNVALISVPFFEDVHNNSG